MVNYWLILASTISNFFSLKVKACLITQLINCVPLFVKTIQYRNCIPISFNLYPNLSIFWRKATAFRKAQFINCVPVFTMSTKTFIFFVLGLLINKLSDKFLQYILNITYVADFFYFINKIKHCFNKFLGMFFLGLNAENTKVEANLLYRLITCFFTRYSAYIFAIILFCFTCSLICVENSLDFFIISLSMYIIHFIIRTYLICLSFCIFLYLTYINTYIKDNYPALYIFIFYSLVIIVVINVYNIISVFKSIVDLVYGFVYMNSDNGTSQGGPTDNSNNSGGGPSGGGPPGDNSGGFWGGDPSGGGPSGGNSGNFGGDPWKGHSREGRSELGDYEQGFQEDVQQDDSQKDDSQKDDIIEGDIKQDEIYPAQKKYSAKIWNEDPIRDEVIHAKKRGIGLDSYHRRMEDPIKRKRLSDWKVQDYQKKMQIPEEKEKIKNKDNKWRENNADRIRERQREYNNRPDVKQRDEKKRQERMNDPAYRESKRLYIENRRKREREEKQNKDKN